MSCVISSLTSRGMMGGMLSSVTHRQRRGPRDPDDMDAVEHRVRGPRRAGGHRAGLSPTARGRPRPPAGSGCRGRRSSSGGTGSRRTGIAGLDDEPRSGRPKTVDDAAIIAATLEPPPERLGVTHWSTRLLARAARDRGRHGGPGLAPVPRAAVAAGDLQVLHRPGARGQGPRRGRAVPRPAREGGRAVRGREEPDPGPQPDRPDPAAAARAARSGPPTTTSATAPPNLFAALEVATGRVTDRATTGTARPSSSTSSSGSRGPTRAGGCASSSTTTTPTSTTTSSVAREAPPGDAPLHPDVGVVAQPRRGVLRHHHPAGDPSRLVRQRPAARRGDPDLHRRLERALPPVRLDQDRRRDPAPRTRQRYSDAGH